MIQNGIRTGVKLFFGSLIQRKEITLYMILKWNLKDIPGTRIKCNAWLLTARYLEYAKDLEPCFGPPAPLNSGYVFYRKAKG